MRDEDDVSSKSFFAEVQAQGTSLFLLACCKHLILTVLGLGVLSPKRGSYHPGTEVPTILGVFIFPPQDNKLHQEAEEGFCFRAAE